MEPERCCSKACCDKAMEPFNAAGQAAGLEIEKQRELSSYKGYRKALEVNNAAQAARFDEGKVHEACEVAMGGQGREMEVVVTQVPRQAAMYVPCRDEVEKRGRGPAEVGVSQPLPRGGTGVSTGLCDGIAQFLCGCDCSGC